MPQSSTYQQASKATEKPLPSISILVLAGGRGSRMGGKDKGLVTINDKPMVSYLLDTLSALSDEVVINCNRHHEEYASFGYPVVNDGNTKFFGPLAGILSGLKVVKNSHMLVVPCDTPAVTARLVKRLQQCAAEFPKHICMANDGNRPQPLHAIIPLSYQQSLIDTMASGQHAVMGWYAQQNLKTVNCEDLPGDFANANSPEELAVLSAILKATAL